MQCSKCGAHSAPGRVFCDNCGKPLPNPDARPAASAPALAGVRAGPQQRVVGAVVAPEPVRTSVNGVCPCGQRNVPGALFCERCGKPLANVDAPGAGADRSIGGRFAAVQPRTGLLGAVNALTRTEALEPGVVSRLFSGALRRRSRLDLDELLVPTRFRSQGSGPVPWPEPWFFVRVLGAILGVVFLLGFYIVLSGQPAYAIPLVTFMNAIVPLTTLTFLYELDARRSTSPAAVAFCLLIGGVLALIVSMYLYGMTENGRASFGAMWAGPVEETAKLAIFWMLAGRRREGTLLRAIVLGGAIGAGFAVFESIQYHFNQSVEAGVQQDSVQVGIVVGLVVNVLRNLLSPFAHILWTSLSAAALWRAVREQGSLGAAVTDSRFLSVFLFAVALHVLNNSPLAAAFTFPILTIAAGLLAWYALLCFVQDGLRHNV